MNHAIAYKTNTITTMDPGRMIVLLYEGAIKFCKQAIVAMESGNIQEKGQKITRATDIIQELKLSLNMEVGGEVAENLLKLYDFMTLHLTKAHLHNDPQKIREVVSLLEELNGAWKTVTA